MKRESTGWAYCCRLSAQPQSTTLVSLCCLLTCRQSTQPQPVTLNSIPMESAEDGETHYMVNTMQDQSMRKARGLLLFGDVDFGYWESFCLPQLSAPYSRQTRLPDSWVQVAESWGYTAFLAQKSPPSPTSLTSWAQPQPHHFHAVLIFF